MKKITRFFSEPKRLAILNAVMLAVLSGFNFLIQGLGVPVPYAIALLAVCLYLPNHVVWHPNPIAPSGATFAYD